FCRNAISCSRIAQRRSKASPAERALASTRSSIEFSLASVTCSCATCPSHSLEAFTISVSLARIKSIGAVKSTYTEEIGVFACPVLERLLDKIAEWHDQPAQVPQADHHIGRGDLLDAAPLVLDDDLVVDADRLRGGDLDAGDEIAQHRPRREADDQAGDAGRGEQAHAVLPHRLERPP